MTAYWPALFIILVVAALAWYHTREVAKAYEDGKRDARAERRGVDVLSHGEKRQLEHYRWLREHESRKPPMLHDGDLVHVIREDRTVVLDVFRSAESRDS